MPLQFDDQSLRMLNDALGENGQIPIGRMYRYTPDECIVRSADDARQWAQAQMQADRLQMQAARDAEAREAQHRLVNHAILHDIYPPRPQGVSQLMLTELSRQNFRYLSELLSTDAVPEVVSKERFDKWWDVKALPLPG